MCDNPSIEIVVRGVCVKDGQLLLCRSGCERNTYLPGGHIEFDESAPVALVREVREELGLDMDAGLFLGTVEHRYIQKKRRICEINLVFELHCADVSSAIAPRSCEPHLSFLWGPVADLASANFEPAVLRTHLPAWVDGQDVPGFLSSYT